MYLAFSLSSYLHFNNLGDFKIPPKYCLHVRSVRVYLTLSFYGDGYVDYIRLG